MSKDKYTICNECGSEFLDLEFMQLKKCMDDFTEFEYENIEEAKVYTNNFELLLLELRNLIEKALRAKNEALSIKALTLLAENTGCADDMRIATHFITCMQDENLLSKKACESFYQNLNIGRWE